jgi:hypothetical protein
MTNEEFDQQYGQWSDEEVHAEIDRLRELGGISATRRRTRTAADAGASGRVRDAGRDEQGAEQEVRRDVMMTHEQRAAYFERLMVARGARSFGELMFIMNAPRSDDAPPPLVWTFTLSIDDVTGDPLDLNTLAADSLTWEARERMMREYGLFRGVPHSDVERLIATYRGLDDRCEACGHYQDTNDRTCEKCGTVAER